MLELPGRFLGHGRYESMERLQVGLQALMGQGILKCKFSDLDLLQDLEGLTQQ